MNKDTSPRPFTGGHFPGASQLDQNFDLKPSNVDTRPPDGNACRGAGLRGSDVFELDRYLLLTAEAAMENGTPVECPWMSAGVRVAG